MSLAKNSQHASARGLIRRVQADWLPLPRAARCPSDTAMDNPDFLVIGGGSAGAVMAARLSQDPATRVLLIEAGRDTPPGALPADIADTFPASSLNPDYFWPGLQCARSPGSPLRPFPQARIMGGGSSVMGLWALRGVPSDFDAWAAAGAEGWGWSDVLPYYRKLENDFDRDQSQSAAKPYPIRRLPREEWPGFVSAIERAAMTRGLPLIDDINERPVEGFFAMPLSQDMTTRASSAQAYLTAAVRRRANLRIMAESRVTGLTFDGLKVCGAAAQQAGEVKEIAAREVILCAGAIHSPAMLLRAGIGPADDLQQLGIVPRLDRAGVGRNLQNHPYLHIALTLPPRSRLAGHLRRFAIAGMRVSSGERGAPPADLLLFMIGRVSPRSYGPDVAMFGAALYAPHSRGAVTLASPAADAESGALCRKPAARPAGGRIIQRRLPAAADNVVASVQSAGALGKHSGAGCQSCAECPIGRHPRHHRQRYPSGPMVRQSERPVAVERHRIARRGRADGAPRRHLRHRPT